jgi:hypothetical protein
VIARVFALLVDAEAEIGCGYPAGERHHLIVLVPADSAEEAAAEAMLALTDRHWCGGEVRQIDRFSVPLESVGDPVMREAAARAFAGDRAIIVYDRP